MKFRLIMFFLLGIAISNLFGETSKSARLVKEAWDFWGKNDQVMVEKTFKKAIIEDNNNTRAYLGLAYLYELQEKYDKSWEHYQHVIKTEKNYYPYIFAGMTTSKMLVNMSKKKSGVLNLYMKLAKEADGDGVLKAIVNERLAEYYQQSGDPKKAAKYFDNIHAITDWYLIGPFDNISASGFANVFPPELEMNYEKEYDGKNGVPANWFKITKVRPDLWIDFRRYFAQSDAVFYGNTFIYSPSKQTVQIRIGTSGSLKAFLNDELVIEYFDENNNDLDTYIAETELQLGWNRLLVKCGYSEISRVNFLARITDSKGEQIPGIKISSAPQSYASTPGAPVKPVKNFAEAWFEEKMKQNPDHLENYLLLADCYLRNDKAIEAELVLREAIKQSPENAMLYSHMVEAYVRGEKNDERLAVLEKIYNLDPLIPMGIEHQFSKNLDNQNFDEAEKSLSQLEAIIPESSKIYQYKIILASKKKLNDRMIELVEQGYKKFPDVWDLVKSKAMLSTYVTQSQDEAIRITKKYLKNHTTGNVFTTLADFYAKNSDLEKWEETFEKLLEYYPASTGYHYQMANTYSMIQNFTKAEEYVNKAIDICQNSSLYWGKLGEIKRITGNTEEAKAAYKKALRFDPSYYDAREKLRELEGKPEIFTYFNSARLDSIINHSPTSDEYPDDGAVILLNDAKRVVYRQGASESTEEILVKVFNNDGIDDFKEYGINYNPYTEELIIEKAVVIKKDGSEIQADIDRNYVVFKSLEEDEFIYIKWKIRNYYRGKLSNHFWDEFYFNLYYPVKDIRYSVLIPDGFKFQVRTQYMSDKPAHVKKVSDGTIYQWRLENEPAVAYEYYMPGLDDIGKKLFITSIENWDYLVNWYLDLAQTKTRSSFEIKEVVEQLFAENRDATEEEKIKTIYDYITENIRYSSVSFRQSGLIPQKARDVLVTRIGDCKDKATLAITMLKEVGINAHYVLVNTRDEGLNNNILPFIAFNHAIAGVETKEGIKYLDLTAQNYPLGSVPMGDLNAFALMIKPGTRQPFYLEENHFIKRKRIRQTRVVLNDDNSMFFQNVTTRAGAQAAYTRNSYRFKGEKEKEQILLESLSKTYPNIKLEHFEIAGIDDISSSITYTYDFTVPDFVSDAGGFKIITLPWTDNLEKDKALSYETRKYPYNYWPNADTLKEELEVTLPSGYIPVELKEEISYSCSVAEFRMNHTYKNGKIKGTRIFINKKPDVTPGEYVEFKEFYNNVLKEDEKSVLLKKAK